MIYPLADIQRVESLRVGSLVNDLGKLALSGVSTAPTILLPTTLFDEWQQLGGVADIEINQLLAWTQSEVSESTKLIIRVSIRETYHGLIDKVITEANFSAIRSVIERIYRSWGDERTRASRLVLKVNESLSIPVLVVQPFFERVYSLVTRHSLTGALTSSADYADNINNQFPDFSNTIDQLVRRCDELLGKPVKVHFTADEELRHLTVFSVSEENMTAGGFLHAFSDMLGRGVIDESQFLRMIKPDMIGTQSGLEVDPQGDSCRVNGIPASAGIVRGRLVFPRGERPLKSNADPLIFLAAEATPEDIHLLTQCSAAIGLAGGMTSHLAVISRGMKIPAVTSCRGKLNLSRRTYQTPDGKEIPEFDAVLVDGSAGIVVFGKVELKRRWILNPENKELVPKIVTCLEKIPFERFKRLPIDVQWHISALKGRLRDLGLIQ